jgi:hypothetical protein
MALTNDESRRLSDIERALSREDPQLSAALASGRPPPSRSLRYGKVLMLVSVPTLAVAVASQQPALGVPAWIGVAGGAVLICAHFMSRAAPPSSPPR